MSYCESANEEIHTTLAQGRKPSWDLGAGIFLHVPCINVILRRCSLCIRKWSILSETSSDHAVAAHERQRYRLLMWRDCHEQNEFLKGMNMVRRQHAMLWIGFRVGGRETDGHFDQKVTFAISKEYPSLTRVVVSGTTAFRLQSSEDVINMVCVFSGILQDETRPYANNQPRDQVPAVARLSTPERGRCCSRPYGYSAITQGSRGC